MARSNLVPYAFVWEKVKTIDFSETIVVYDIKVGSCSQLNEYMKLYEYQRSRSFIDFGPNLSDSIFSNFFFSITTWLIETKCHVEPPWDGRTKVCSNGLGHMTKWPSCLYMIKTFKNLFCGIKRLMTLKFGLQHRIHKYYLFCSNDALG